MQVSEGVLLRRVSRDGVRQTAAEFDNPLAYSASQYLALTISQGDPETAVEAIVDWLEDQVAIGMRDGWAESEWATLLAAYRQKRSRISGLARTMRTELSLQSEIVDEDFGRVDHTWKAWAKRDNLIRLFDTAHGNEVQLVAPKGKGKTNLKCLFGGEWASIGPEYHVLHNINGLSVQGKRLDGRFHRVRFLSEIIKTWLSLPSGTQFLFLFDEPAQVLHTKAGGSDDINAWNLFRPQLRKMDITICYGWQKHKQIFPMLREAIGDDDTVPAIYKPTQESMVVDQIINEKRCKTTVVNVPATEKVLYNTKGWANLQCDVDFSRLTLMTAHCDTDEQLRDALSKEIQDPRNYYEKFWEIHGFEAPDAIDHEARLADVAQAIRDNLPMHLGPSGRLTRNSILAIHGTKVKGHGQGVTQPEAEALARKLNEEMMV